MTQSTNNQSDSAFSDNCIPRAPPSLGPKGERSTSCPRGGARMDPLEFPGTIEDGEDIQVEESDSDEEEVTQLLLYFTVRPVVVVHVSFQLWRSHHGSFACRFCL